MNSNETSAWIDDPVVQDLLSSTVPARFGYVWPDQSPRVVPMWFHWTRSEFVMASPEGAPKGRVLHEGQPVALSIDSHVLPYKVLMVRGENVNQVWPHRDRLKWPHPRPVH